LPDFVAKGASSIESLITESLEIAQTKFNG